MPLLNEPRIVVVGLGYVGLPLAIALADHFTVVGLDTDKSRIAELRDAHDRTNEIGPDRLRSTPLVLTDSADEARGADFYIVTVPTPVDASNRPDLTPVLGATRTLAALLDAERPTTIVYESTVYPGVTEEICGPLIEEVSGLKRGTHFFLGYSPERINPGDREHTIDRITKVVAGENDEVAAQLEQVYGKATTGGTFRAASIKTAEAAKVIENAQRDINIAFMNEITQIFARLGLSTGDVLEAARTKWNFLPFHPGLVGGHCIGVDPYYLSHCAQNLGYLPRVILAGRATNDGMGSWIADQIHARRGSRKASVLMLGLAFKPDVPDVRNSKVVDVIQRLTWLGHDVTVHDPLVDPAAASHEYDLALDPHALGRAYDVVVAAVPHAAYSALDGAAVEALVSEGGLLADLHGIWRGVDLPVTIDRWSL